MPLPKLSDAQLEVFPKLNFTYKSSSFRVQVRRIPNAFSQEEKRTSCDGQTGGALRSRVPPLTLIAAIAARSFGWKQLFKKLENGSTKSLVQMVSHRRWDQWSK